MESPLNPEDKFRLLPLAALAVIFVIAAPVFWQEVELRPSTVAYSPENEDLRDYYAPVYRQTFGALLSQRIPAWDATRLCGAPIIGDPRISIFQPLNVVFLLAPFPEAFAVHAFTCLVMSGIAFVLFARSMGVGVTAALFGALCFTFSGAAAGAMSRPPLAAAMAWIPIVLWSARAYAQQPRAASVVFMGLALAGLLLSGALAVYAMTLCVVFAYVMTAAIATGSRRIDSVMRTMSGFVAAVCLCACICAVQLLPTIRLAVRMADPTLMARSVLPAGTLPDGLVEAALQLVAPESASLPSLIYLGIVGLVFLPAAILQRRRLVDGVFYLTVAVGLIALAVAYGAEFPGMLPAYAAVYPAMGCAAAASALGADRIMRKRMGPGREWYWLSAGLVICSCVAVFVLGNTLTRGYATVTIALVAGLLIASHSTIRVVVGLVLCGLVWTNLVTASRNVFGHPFASDSSDRILNDRTGPSRLVRSRMVAAGTIRNGFPGFGDPMWRADGYGALFTPVEAAWWRTLSETEAPSGSLETLPDLNLLGVMAVRTVLAGHGVDLSGAKSAWGTSSAGYRYTTIEGANPRAQWVTRVEWTDSIEDTISSIQKRDDDARPVAYVDSRNRNVAGLAALNENADTMNVNATASIQDRSPEHVVITMRTPVPGLLVLADSFSPDWQAEIDGTPTTIFRVNGIFRGVLVPKGDHVVDFRYKPVALYAGGILSIGTLVLLVLWGLVRLFR